MRKQKDHEERLRLKGEAETVKRTEDQLTSR